MNLTCGRVLIVFGLILIWVSAVGQSRPNKSNGFAPQISVGYSSSFYTNQFRAKNVSPKPYNSRDKSGFSCSIGAFRKRQSKKGSFGFVARYFSSRTIYTYANTQSVLDSSYTDMYKINNCHYSWYIGVPMTWSLLNKKKKSPIYLGLTCEPLLFIVSYHNKHTSSSTENYGERYFSYSYSPLSMMLACAVGYRYSLEKKSELLITLNNQLQVFNSFNEHSHFFMHRHNIELGLTYFY